MFRYRFIRGCTCSLRSQIYLAKKHQLSWRGILYATAMERVTVFAPGRCLRDCLFARSANSSISNSSWHLAPTLVRTGLRGGVWYTRFGPPQQRQRCPSICSSYVMMVFLVRWRTAPYRIDWVLFIFLLPWGVNQPILNPQDLVNRMSVQSSKIVGEMVL